jgi:hypothetical protein
VITIGTCDAAKAVYGYADFTPIVAKNLGFGGFVEAVQQMRAAYRDREDRHDISSKDASAEPRGIA